MNQKVKYLRDVDGGAARRRTTDVDSLGEMSVAAFPDCVVMPSQFFGRQRCSQSEGERRLMLAVVEEAINCYCKTSFARDAHRVKLHQGAESWLFSEDRSWFFSFANICDVLSLDADCLRDTLRQWKRGQAAARTQRAAALYSHAPHEAGRVRSTA
jgi:hypothetical protein